MMNFPAAKQDPSAESASSQLLLQQRSAPAHLQFRDAAIAHERNGRNRYNIGFLYLHAAWCADDSGASPQASAYRRLAAEAFSQAIRTSACPLGRESEVEYLIGELLRRSGDFQAARDHFARVIVKLPTQFALMARKLMRLADLQNSEAIPFVFEAKN
jgi:tetratricopeptide (TPR) repeat protein